MDRIPIDRSSDELIHAIDAVANVEAEGIEHAVEATVNVDAEELEKAVEATKYQEVNTEIQIGYVAKANAGGDIAIGYGAEADKNGSTYQLGSVAIGRSSKAEFGGVAIGLEAKAPESDAIAIGTGSEAGNKGLALGRIATATQRAVQIGPATNNDQYTFKYANGKIQDGEYINTTIVNADGKIPIKSIEEITFLVTYTGTVYYNPSTGIETIEYRADKTYAQIKQAIQNGEIVYALINVKGTRFVSLYDYDSYEVVFAGTIKMSGSDQPSWIKVEHDNNNVIAVTNDMLGGGGSGGSLFVATYTESEGTYTCDKTLSEILSAIADGNVVVADVGGTQYSLTASSNDIAVFSLVLQEGGNFYLLTIAHEAQEITVSQEAIGGGVTYTAGQNITITNNEISAGMETIIV